VIRFWMDGVDEPVVVREKDDIADYGHPLAPAALSKTGVLCMGLIDLDDTRSLAEQLADNLGGGGAIGLEVVTASRLPMGSGLGGSSILGGTLLQALGTCVGRQYDRASLVHAGPGGWAVRRLQGLPIRCTAAP
jgi:galactokinase